MRFKFPVRPLTLLTYLWIAVNFNAYAQQSSVEEVPEDNQNNRPAVTTTQKQQTPADEWISPELGSFPKQILTNFGGLFARQNLPPLVVGSVATGLATSVDDELEDFFGSKRRAEALGDTGHILANGGTIGAITGVLLFSAYKTENHKFRSMSYSLAQGFVLDMVLTQSLKVVISRERPSGEDDHAFPSGHTSEAVMVSRVISSYYPRARVPSYIIAGLIGISRLEKSKHHLSDVVAGATLGYIVGATVVRGTQKRAGHPQISCMPLILADGGFAISTRVSF